MEFNNFVRRNAVSSVADTDNVWNHRSQTDPFKFTFMISIPRNGGQTKYMPRDFKTFKTEVGVESAEMA